MGREVNTRMTLTSTDVFDLPLYARAHHGLRKLSGPQRQKIREEAGFTRARLAELLGIPLSTLRKWETTSTPAEADAVRYLNVLQSLLQPEELPEEDALKAAEYFQAHFEQNPPKVCPHCGGLHARACPRVKRIVRHADGTWIEAEYWPDWVKTYVVFPDTLGGSDE